ncbi:2-dehydro-3-deoxy-6-phosphogalactonate aldolase [Piscinibacter sp.]|jgi:2-dehydro-3-deoxyphosphogalactonate aldolase|uniref:2-dehydro-3-deoxy-6-phosphogalactonate aldolase n=1 Tax=Piscinibacter sp. TaxID=1903157 RepID=UPI003559B862
MNARDLSLPLVAILRGLQPAEVQPLGRVLFDAGFRMLEVPLNRPGALECIAALRAIAPAGSLVGGGTMLSVADVENVHAAGGQLMVAPNCDPAVIRRAADLGLWCAPGIATPTEAFMALRSGAHALKIFPADMVGFEGLVALQSVLPQHTPLWPVGGITPDSLAPWRHAGATGFGIGSQLYQPGVSAQALSARARVFGEAWQIAARGEALG